MFPILLFLSLFPSVLYPSKFSSFPPTCHIDFVSNLSHRFLTITKSDQIFPTYLPSILNNIPLLLYTFPAFDSTILIPSIYPIYSFKSIYFVYS